MKQILYTFCLLTLTVFKLSCATVPIPVVPGNPSADEVAVLRNILNESGIDKLETSALIRHKPSRLFPGINKKIAPAKNNYNFPVGEILEEAVADALYTVFEPPANNISDTFFIDIYLDKFRLYHYGPSDKDLATCEITVRIKINTPNGLNSVVTR